MNYSEVINEVYDPLLGLTKQEANEYLEENEKDIKDKIFLALVMFLGVEKIVYRRTGITIFDRTKKKLRKWFRSGGKVVDSNVLGTTKKEMQGVLTRAKEFNQQVLKQEHLRLKYNQDETVELLWYVLNEKTSNHCPFCLANNEKKIYVKGQEPKLPQEEGHGGVGYGCYCYYLPIRTKDDLKTYSKLDEDRQFIKDWWKDSYLSNYFDDDKTNGELP